MVLSTLTRAPFARFAIAGAVGLAINLLISYVLTEYAGWWYLWSFCIGALAAWTTSFLINAGITFVTGPAPFWVWVQRYIDFLAGYLGIGVCALLGVYMLTTLSGFPYLLSVVVMTFGTTLATFSYSRTQVFVSHGEGAGLSLLLRRHLLAVILAIIVGALCVGPWVHVRQAPSYQGVAPLGPDAEEHYEAQVREVYDGYPGLGNVFLPDKNQPYVQPGLGPILLAVLGKALGLGANAISVAAKFFLPTALALLFYALAYALSGSVAVGLLAGASLVADALMSGIGPWRALLSGASDLTGFLPLSRAINPEISNIFLFGALLLFYKAFWGGRAPRFWHSVVGGLLVGASWYISIYVSSFLFVVLVLSGAYFWWRRERANFWHAIGAVGVAALALLPFAINYFHLRADTAYADVAMRMGLVATHAPALSIWLPILALVAYFFWPTRYLPARPFFLTLVGALIVVTEQQILTGLELQFSHYHWYITKPIIGLMGACVGVFLVEKYVRGRVLQQGLFALTIVVCLYNAVLIQRHSYEAVLPATLKAQQYAPILSFLDARGAQETVFADRFLTPYIPIYTHDDAPNSDHAPYYLVPEQYLVDRLLVEYKLRGVPPQEAFATMRTERADIASRLFGVYYRDQFGSYAAIPDALLESYAAQYGKVYTEPLAMALKRLRATLIVWDTVVEPQWHLDTRLAGKPLYEENGIAVYQVP